MDHSFPTILECNHQSRVQDNRVPKCQQVVVGVMLQVLAAVGPLVRSSQVVAQPRSYQSSNPPAAPLPFSLSH